MSIRFPAVHVQLSGEDGNAFSIMGRAQRAARKAGIPQDVINIYLAECKAGDYDHLLQTTMRWFACDHD